MKNLLTLCFFTLVLLYSCDNSSTTKEPQKTLSGKKLIPNKYAEGFSIYNTDEGLFFEIKNPQTKEIVDTFSFVKNTNFKNVITFSSTYISFLDRIGEIDKIKGVTYSNGIFNPAIKSKLASREIIDIGTDNQPNKELILSINPDVIFSFPNKDNLEWLNEFSIPDIEITEYLETHPLAQAEWLRFFGHLFNKSQLADSIFNVIEKEYIELANNNKNKANKPLVLGGELYDNSWTLPGGKSVTSKLIADAGGTFLNFGDSTSGSYKIDFEIIINNQKDIDFWLFPTYDFNEITKEYLVKKEPKYEFLEIISSNNIGVCNTSKSPYFEKGIIEPHVILNDLVNLFNNQSDNNTYFKTIK